MSQESHVKEEPKLEYGDARLTSWGWALGDADRCVRGLDSEQQHTLEQLALRDCFVRLERVPNVEALAKQRNLQDTDMKDIKDKRIEVEQVCIGGKQPESGRARSSYTLPGCFVRLERVPHIEALAKQTNLQDTDMKDIKDKRIKVEQVCIGGKQPDSGRARSSYHPGCFVRLERVSHVEALAKQRNLQDTSDTTDMKDTKDKRIKEQMCILF